MSDQTHDKSISKAERTYDGVLKRYDLPRDEAIKRISEIKTASQNRSKLYFKYTCQNCKARCIFGVPDTLYEIGICPDCNQETEIVEAGFMVVTEFGKRNKQVDTITSNNNDDISNRPNVTAP